MDKKYLAGFGAFRGINSIIWNKLFGYFPDIKTAWKSPIPDFIKSGMTSKVANELANHISNFDIENYYKKLERIGINIISIKDVEYPILLKEIPTPPFVIYVKGKLKPEDENAIAIVGSRKATDYGKRATAEISEELARAGITIVSGLALGLDTEAHSAAVNAGGRTIAVLANGLDTIYPIANIGLAKKILENGAIISEQPLGMPALKQNFPARNRIISGLSQGVLITEAGDKSGTLHTANFALEQNRQVYAVPGPIYNPLAHGPNMLIKSGAKAVTCAQDILEDFGIEENLIPIEPENDDERLIFSILETGAQHIDEITKKAERPPQEISRILSLMEIKGKLRHLGGMVYALK